MEKIILAKYKNTVDVSKTNILRYKTEQKVL